MRKTNLHNHVKNMDESTKLAINANVEKLDKLILDEKDYISLFESYSEPVTSDRLTAYMKMANQQEIYLNENLNVTGDIAKYNQQLQPILRRVITQLNAFDLASVQPINVPDASVFAIKPVYSGYLSTEDTKPLIVVTGEHPTADITISKGDTINGNGGATAEVIFVDFGVGNNKKTANILAKVTNTGNGFVAGDDLGGGVIVKGAYTNQMFFKQILPSYTGSFDTGVGERLGSGNTGDGTEFPEMGITIEKLPVSAKTRKIKARITLELLQDVDSLFGLNGKDEIFNFMAGEIALEIDYTIINEYKKIAKAEADFKVATTTDSQGRFHEEMYKGLLQRIVNTANNIANTSRRGRGNNLITTTGVITALQSIGAFATQVDMTNPNTFYIGTLKNGTKVYHDFLSSKEYVLVFRKGSNAFDAPIIYSPYIPLQVLEATDPKTLQPVLGMMSRDAITSNGLLDDEPSDSVTYFGVDFADTPLKPQARI